MRAESLLLLLLAGCGPKDPTTTTAAAEAPAQRCGKHADGSQTFGVLHLNDVYRIEGLLDGRGGLARVAALRTQLAATCSDLLVTHGGDALSPSLLSKSTNGGNKVRFYGAHMVDILSLLDGDGEAFDPHMVVAIGNHEFDQSGADFAPKLDRLFEQSQFTWLDTGLKWDEQIAADNLVATHIIELSGMKVGLFGATIDRPGVGYVTTDSDYKAIAEQAIASLQADGAQVILGVTHLDVADDLQLLKELDTTPHLILGGHNHTAMTRSNDGDPRQVLKADADATTVRVAYVTLHPDGSVTVDAEEPRALGPDDPEDPLVRGAVDGWLAALDATFCGIEELGCLGEKLTATKTDLIAEELMIRMYETNLGDWVVDQAMGVFAAHEPDLAFVNSGGLRLNQNISAGTAIPRQVVEELFPYSAPLTLIELTGEEIQAAANRSVEAWSGNGHWLQISGWGFRHDPDAGTASGLSLLPLDGGAATPIDPKATYKVVVNDYLINESMDRDGYTFPIRTVDVPENGTDLKVVVVDTLRAAGDAGIAPERDGRICNTQETDAPCRIP